MYSKFLVLQVEARNKFAKEKSLNAKEIEKLLGNEDCLINQGTSEELIYSLVKRMSVLAVCWIFMHFVYILD